jgi:hypothetical protein
VPSRSRLQGFFSGLLAIFRPPSARPSYVGDVYDVAAIAIALACFALAFAFLYLLERI